MDTFEQLSYRAVDSIDAYQQKNIEWMKEELRTKIEKFDKKLEELKRLRYQSIMSTCHLELAA